MRASSTFRSGELIEVACEHIRHLVRRLQVPVSEAVHRDTVERRSQPPPFVLRITPAVEQARLGKDVDGDSACAVHGDAELAGRRLVLVSESTPN